MHSFLSLEKIVGYAMDRIVNNVSFLDERLEKLDNNTLKMFFDFAYKLGPPKETSIQDYSKLYEGKSYDELFEIFKTKIIKKFPDYNCN